jgi:hypothetical protein
LSRDGKDGRYGLGLGQTQVTTTARLDRLILILALALILLIGLGRIARGRFPAGDVVQQQRPGRVQRRDGRPADVGTDRRAAERLLDEVVRATYLSVGKWG